MKAPLVVVALAVAGTLLASGCAKRVLVQPAVDVTKYNRVAVLPFETDSYLSTIGHQLADEIVVDILQKAPNLDVVERTQVEALMMEQNLARQGYLSPESAIQLGRMLGVRLIATGSVSVSIGNVNPSTVNTQRVATGVATLRLIDTETGKVLWAKREKSEYSTFVSLDHQRTTFNTMTDQDLFQEVVKQLGQELAQAFYPHYELQY